jgi:hypothetical protein
MAGQQLRPVGLPDLGLALPLHSEERWSDLLAVLLCTDPAPALRLLGLSVDPAGITVHREQRVSTRDRPDIVLRRGEQCLAVIEVKVLSGLGRHQLSRYRESTPDAETYILICPGTLILDATSHDGWQAVSWERILWAYTKSDHSWAVASARSWLHHLSSSLPQLEASTVWNDMTEGEDFVIALRSRMSWVHEHVNLAAYVSHELHPSSAGTSWIEYLAAETPVPGYRILAEIEETLAVRCYPKWAGPEVAPARGPSARVMLQQVGITTSAGFDWDYLLRLWPLMSSHCPDWVTNKPRSKALHDRQGILRIRQQGGPDHLGIGFGEGQARINQTCMFGARLKYPATITLGELVSKVQDLSHLVAEMSRYPALSRPG